MNLQCIFGHKWNGCKCKRCGKTRDEQHSWHKGKCKVCGATQPISEADIAMQQNQQMQRKQIASAVHTLFNTDAFDITNDPDDTRWKSNVQKEVELIAKGGNDSASILGGLLMQCADGQGMAISDSWWYGSRLVVKAAALLPQKEAIALMLRLLNKDSQIVEWFTYVQKEAAIQLGKIGDTDVISALQKHLDKPLSSMSPTAEIAQTIEKLGGTIAFSAELCLVEVQNKMPNDRIEYYFTIKDKIDSSWTPQQKAFLYYLIGKAAEAGFADPEYRESNLKYAFFAAQLYIRPENTSAGWQLFTPHGFTCSKENAIRLHEAYPLPQNIEEARNYKATFIQADI